MTGSERLFLLCSVTGFGSGGFCKPQAGDGKKKDL